MVVDDKPVVLYGMSAYVSATVVTTYSTPKQIHAKEVFQMDKNYPENDECAVSPVIALGRRHSEWAATSTRLIWW